MLVTRGKHNIWVHGDIKTDSKSVQNYQLFKKKSGCNFGENILQPK